MSTEIEMRRRNGLAEAETIPATPTRSPFLLSLERIHALAGRRVVERGIVYALSGRVMEVSERLGMLQAKVEGSAGQPYLVTIIDDGDGELLPSCSCPFEWEPFCKHAIAALAHYSKISAKEWQSFLSQMKVDRPEDEELEARRERALKQPMRVRRVKRGPQGSLLFYVSSASYAMKGRPYEVEIRSLDERLNRCTCADFENSMLGTCKHIEAVLYKIGRSPASQLRAIRKAIENKVRVVLSREGGPKLVLQLPRPHTEGGDGRNGSRALLDGKIRRIASKFFDSTGTLRGDPVAAVERIQEHGGIEVSDDALRYVELLALERKRKVAGEEMKREVYETGGALPGFKGKLFPYQLDGVAFLVSASRALLADDMGLGKTVEAIAAAHFLKRRGDAWRVLVVCPASLKRQWAEEIKRFTPWSVSVISGPRAERKKFYRKACDFTIVNYELILRDFDLIEEGMYDILILDEAQRIKNWRTKTAEAVKSIRTRSVFVLTGTPMENRLDDLYSIMQVVDRRVLGPLWAFNEKFVEVEECNGRRVTKYRNLSELRRRLRSVMLRRDRSEVLSQLPERTVNRYYTPITNNQRDRMLEAEAQAAKLAAISRKRPLTPDELKRLLAFLQIARMACNCLRLVDSKGPDESPKLEEFEKVLAEVCIESGRKAVVFTQWEIFQRMAASVAQRLGIGYVRLHGAVPSNKRGDLIAKFKNDPNCRVFFSTDAGGVGLNLQCASVVINLDLPWNPAVLEQRIGRVHRMGQKEKVSVLLLISENSFEHRMEKLLAGKQELFDAAILPDSTTEEVVVPSMALAVANLLFSSIECNEEAEIEEFEEKIKALYGKETEKETEASWAVCSAAPASMPPPPSPLVFQSPLLTVGDVVADAAGTAAATSAGAGTGATDLGRLLGHRLRCILRLPSTYEIAVVDNLDDLTREAARSVGAVAIDEASMESLLAIGSLSPLAGAVIVDDRRHSSGGSPSSGDGEAIGERERRRTEMMEVASRRMKAAENMAAAGLGAEAISMAHYAVEAALRSKAARAGKEARSFASALYEVLLPEGRITLEQVAIASKTESIARAYSETTLPPPPSLVAATLEDAWNLVRSCLADP